MKKCLYHKIQHPLCPVFNLGYVVRESGQDFRSLAEKVWMGWEGGRQQGGDSWVSRHRLTAPFCLPLTQAKCVHETVP